MGNSKTPMRVAVVGGGFSGLTLAALLAAKGFTVSVFEKDQGFITSENSHGILFENAAPSLLNHHEIETFFTNYGLKTIRPMNSAKKKFIYYDQLCRWPLGIKASLIFVLKIIKFLFLNDKINSLQGLSVETWSQLHFGSEFTDKVLRTALFGVYACDISELNAELVLSRFFLKRLNKAKFKGSVIPEGGLSNFLNLLRHDLLKKNVQFYAQNLNASDLLKLNESAIVVLATGFSEFVKLTSEKPENFLKFDSEFAIEKWQILSKSIKCISLAKVHLLFNGARHKIAGFGVLFHPKNKFNSMGAIANSQVFSEYGPEYNESWILQDAANESLLLQYVLADRERLFKSADQIKKSSVHISKNIYPVYSQDLLLWIRSTRLKEGFFATGNYWGALGLSQIFLQNLNLAKNIEDYAKK